MAAVQNNAKNIVVGAGVLYIGTSQTSVYDETDLPKSPTTFDASGTFQDPDNVDDTKWRNVGYTSDGASITFTPDYGEVQVDQLLDVAKIFKQGQQVMVATTLTEATLENLLITLGGVDEDLGSAVASGTNSQEMIVNGGSLGYSPIERSIAIVGPAPDSLKTVVSGKTKAERVYIGYRALSMETVEVGIRRNEATVFPVNFRLLPDSTKVAADGVSATYGKIIDRVYA